MKALTSPPPAPRALRQATLVVCSHNVSVDGLDCDSRVTHARRNCENRA